MDRRTLKNGPPPSGKFRPENEGLGGKGNHGNHQPDSPALSSPFDRKKPRDPEVIEEERRIEKTQLAHLEEESLHLEKSIGSCHGEEAFWRKISTMEKDGSGDPFPVQHSGMGGAAWWRFVEKIVSSVGDPFMNDRELNEGLPSASRTFFLPADP